MTNFEMTEQEYMALAQKAERIGQEHGENAGTWVFDGNTSQATYEYVLKGINEGDPAVYDMFNEPNLSGEFGGDYSFSDLAYDLGIDQYENVEILDDFAEAYQVGASDGFWHEIERACVYQLSD